MFEVRKTAGFETLGSIESVPRNVQFLSKCAGEVVGLSHLSLVFNPSCFHAQALNHQEPSYYQDYLMTTTYSEKQQNLQREQVEVICRLYGGNPRSLVEIGCGDGSFLLNARTCISRVVGIEPSERFASEARSRGLEVIVGYVGESSSLTAEKFDAFVSRQVFEHLPDPVGVLFGIKNMLNPGAVGLIEVPNGWRALREKRFFEFFSDHVNYYSVNSLVALASYVGLTVVSCQESFGGDYLELWVKNEVFRNEVLQNMVEVRSILTDDITRVVEMFSSGGKRVLVWGSGAKALCMFACLNSVTLNRVTAVVDSDPHKQGCFIPNSRIPIVCPADGAAMMPDVVIVLALSYIDEIVRSIRLKFNKETRVFTVSGENRLVELE